MMMSLNDCIATINGAVDPFELEVAMQNAFNRYDNQRAIRRIRIAVKIKGRQLCCQSTKNDFIPRISSTNRLILMLQSVKLVGNKDNLSYKIAEQFVRDTLRNAGINDIVIDAVWLWWLDYPHRALAAILTCDLINF